MCRNIKTLRNPADPPTEVDFRLAALQFVRKVSGYRTPSRANQQVFDAAVEQIAQSTRELLEGLIVRSSTPGTLG